MPDYRVRLRVTYVDIITVDINDDDEDVAWDRARDEAWDIEAVRHLFPDDIEVLEVREVSYA